MKEKNMTMNVCKNNIYTRAWKPRIERTPKRSIELRCPVSPIYNYILLVKFSMRHSLFFVALLNSDRPFFFLFSTATTTHWEILCNFFRSLSSLYYLAALFSMLFRCHSFKVHDTDFPCWNFLFFFQFFFHISIKPQHSLRFKTFVFTTFPSLSSWWLSSNVHIQYLHLPLSFCFSLICFRNTSCNRKLRFVVVVVFVGAFVK